MSEKITLKIKISKKCLNKLKEKLYLVEGDEENSKDQKKFLKNIEKLIEKNLENMYNNNQVQEIQNKMQEFLKTFGDSSFEIDDIFNTNKNKKNFYKKSFYKKS